MSQFEQLLGLWKPGDVIACVQKRDELATIGEGAADPQCVAERIPAPIVPALMDRKAIDADACQFIESSALGTRVAQSSQALIAAMINGAGCLTLLAYQSVEISGSTASGPQQQMGSAWVGIASAPGSARTIYEWE